MFFNCNTNMGEMSPKSDFGIVPEDAYSSPANSPGSCHAYEPVYSPASSDTGSVDSAFGELAEVIPEIESDLSGSESQRTYSDLTNASWGSPSGYHCEDSGYMLDESNRSPSMYDAVFPMSPEKHEPEIKSTFELMQAAKLMSAKRTSPFWFSDNFDFADMPSSVTSAKRAKFSAPVQTEIRVSNLVAEAKKMPKLDYQDNFMYQDELPRENSIVQDSSVSQEQDKPTQGSGMRGSLLRLDEKILTKGFEVLAQYLCSDTLVKEDEKKEERPEESAKVNVEDGISHAKVLAMVNQYRASMQKAFSLPVTKNVVPQEVDRPTEQLIMFSMSNTKPAQSEAKKVPLKRSQPNTKSTADLVRNWRAPTRQKRPNLAMPTSKPRLYNFLLELLRDPESYPCIEWVDEAQGVFKFLDSAKIAGLWGHRKNKPNMKYENFARSLRTYIAKGILTKPRNKLVYQFTSKFV